MEYREHPEATAELQDAVRWCGSKQISLGEEIAALADEAVDDVLAMPETWPVFPSWDEEPLVRTRGVGKCPYRVVYYVEDDTDAVIVIAYAHTSRRPGCWRTRITLLP